MSRLFFGLLVVLITLVAQAREPLRIHEGAECGHLKGNESTKAINQSLKILADKLNLSEHQKPLWREWSNQLSKADSPKDKFNRTTIERRELPATERQVKWITSAETHIQAIKDSLPALKTLYITFTDAQKSAFDREVPF